jgi:hypothetical protein
MMRLVQGDSNRQIQRMHWGYGLNSAAFAPECRSAKKKSSKKFVTHHCVVRGCYAALCLLMQVCQEEKQQGS